MYSGTLYFEDGDPVEVRWFIVRDDEIAFDLTGGWGEHGMWTRGGIARQQGPEFHSDVAPSFQEGVEGYPCKIVFQTVRGGDVEGYWFEEGETRTFSGSLEEKP